MISEKVTISNKLGLHARASAKIVTCASHYHAELYLIYREKRANAKSIMAVMMLGAGLGKEIDIEANGPDENEALNAMVALFSAKFGEEA